VGMNPVNLGTGQKLYFLCIWGWPTLNNCRYAWSLVPQLRGWPGNLFSIKGPVLVFPLYGDDPSG